MRQIKTSIFISLDGVVDADSDWQYAYFDEQLFEELGNDWNSSTTVLLGKNSFKGYDRLKVEHPDSPILTYLNSVNVYVVSDDSEVANDWPKATVIAGKDLENTILKLREADGGDILVLGSPTLLRSLLAYGLIDDLKIMILPVIVGDGVRLFESTPSVKRLRLQMKETRTLGSGIIIVNYKPIK